MQEKVLIVLRGGCSRVNNPLVICKNIEVQILNPLRMKGYHVDCIFSTTSKGDPKLDVYSEYLKPLTTFYTSNGQIVNFKETLWNLRNIYSNYVQIVFLRFEIVYKINIDEMNIMKNTGLMLPFKEDGEELFRTHKYYGDCIIIICSLHFSNILDTFVEADFHTISTGFGHDILHRIVDVILSKFPETPICCILNGFFQSNTNYPADNPKLNPLYILTHYPYCGDKQYLLDIGYYTR
jgi:hypothetical protein